MGELSRLLQSDRIVKEPFDTVSQNHIVAVLRDEV